MAAGTRYREDVTSLLGRPDIVFPVAQVVVFRDGYFRHGKDWGERRAKFSRGASPEYWIAKVEGNMALDRRVNASLEQAGWIVMRLWESEIRRQRMMLSRQSNTPLCVGGVPAASRACNEGGPPGVLASADQVEENHVALRCPTDGQALNH